MPNAADSPELFSTLGLGEAGIKEHQTVGQAPALVPALCENRLSVIPRDLSRSKQRLQVADALLQVCEVKGYTFALCFEVLRLHIPMHKIILGSLG
ncbi:MAG TPA: hypothetical protein VIG38_07300 [Hyphomicrobium sp.]